MAKVESVERAEYNNEGLLEEAVYERDFGQNVYVRLVDEEQLRYVLEADEEVQIVASKDKVKASYDNLSIEDASEFSSVLRQEELRLHYRLQHPVRYTVYLRTSLAIPVGWSRFLPSQL